MGQGRRPRSRTSAQAMVEFAIVLPILLVVVFGVIEVGRLVYIYSAITNASREAVRYGSAWGSMATGYQYRDCAGIRAVAKKVAILVPLQDSDIIIKYDTGPGTSAYAFNCDAVSGQDLDVQLNSADRIKVTVCTKFTAMASLVPLSIQRRTGSQCINPQANIESTSYRTVMGIITLFQPTPTPSSP